MRHPWGFLDNGLRERAEVSDFQLNGGRESTSYLPVVEAVENTF